MSDISYHLETLKKDYLDYLVTLDKSKHTIENFDRILSRFVAFSQEQLNIDNQSAISAKLVLEFIAHIKSKGEYKTSSIRFYIQVLRAWAAFLAQIGPLEGNPLDGEKLLPTLPDVTPQIITDDQIDSIIDSFDPRTPIGARNRAIIRLLVDTGLRVSELVSLTLDDIDLEHRDLVVLGKGRKQRRLGFGHTTGKSLRTYLEHRNRIAHGNGGAEKRRVFLCHGGCGRHEKSSMIGKPLSDHGVKEIFSRLQRQLNIRISAHALRRKFSAEFLLAGGSVNALQALLGHSTPTMSMFYAQILDTQAVSIQKSTSYIDRMNFKRRRR